MKLEPGTGKKSNNFNSYFEFPFPVLKKNIHLSKSKQKTRELFSRNVEN